MESLRLTTGAKTFALVKQRANFHQVALE